MPVDMAVLEHRLQPLLAGDGSLSGQDALVLLHEVEQLLGAGLPRPEDRDVWWRFLAASGRPRFLRALGDDAARRRWAEAVFTIIEATHYTLGDLFAQVVREIPDHVLFHRADDARAPDWTYERTARHLHATAAMLLGPVPARPATSPAAPGRPRVATLAENSLAIASVDLACLLHDIFVTPLSIHFDVENLAWICQRLLVDTVVTDSEERLLKLHEVRERVGRPTRILLTDPDLADPRRDVQALAPEIAALGPDAIAARLDARPRFGMRDTCTVMFTSGSTGRPKGVAFNQQNLVSKRFARAAALPDVGENEVLLCYLPLFHTFGRYLELLGSIYWRGTYAFAGNPSAETLLSQLREVRPTGLISIPLRWMQIYERCERAFGTDVEPSRQQDLFREVTGGRLRWGLSAAGYLEPRVFRFFQRHGVQVCSGFGMTEGTGGLTMTPPDDYVENSVGLPLPGTRVRFGEEGELQIAGPYIARYLPEETEPGDLTVPDQTSDEHWIATGDLFRADRARTSAHRRPHQGHLQEQQGPDHRAAQGGGAVRGVPGIRRTFLVGRRPRVQHAADRARPRRRDPARPLRRGGARLLPAPRDAGRTLTSPPTSGW